MAHKDRKIRKMRGTRNCGWGNTQKHRGAGSRGGRGMGGSKKQKWSYVSKYLPEHFGRRGFRRPLDVVKKDVVLNLGVLEENLDVLVKEGKAVFRDDKYIIDLTSLGYDKLLGSGEVKHRLEITAPKASKKAVEKVEALGGVVKILSNSNTLPQ